MPNDLTFYHDLRARAERIAANNPSATIRILGRPPRPEKRRPVASPPPVVTEAKMAPKARANSRKIMAVVCSVWELETARLALPERTKRASEPRFACYWLLRERLNLSTAVIGRLLGRRDHTTVIHGLLRARTLYAHNTPWREKYNTAVDALNLIDGPTP